MADDQRLPHILFTPSHSSGSLSASEDDWLSTIADTNSTDMMSDALFAKTESAVTDETLLAMQELKINTTHPLLAHTLRQEQSSVLSLAADSRHIFSGSQGKDIYVRLDSTQPRCSGSI